MGLGGQIEREIERKNQFLVLFIKENFHPTYELMKYIIYARKSTEDENHQILSIESQLCELREFAAKEKLEIVGSTFVETKTAKEPKKYRPEPHFVKEKFYSTFNQKGGNKK
ncbi:hypothetical protein A3G50_01445 [Candidatus Jorgensenbacteria bacterium RIFCSPLOWO2_12_FULL_42_11]|uniref:Resolvase/invertase-type recombinase catalytic domain-containing protein n=2 Tax=Parcubacteria group TaxID=1794811 RepID=A0A1F6C2L4_9BACT|nr:MAG: hypothetical protein A3G50_01445 [Candidatus Jorgensenbacteria bacterium RIFCSPLOWO2_12_FULL_42_11]